MTESKEIQVLHKVNTGMRVLMDNLTDVISNLSELTELLYNKEMDKVDKEIENINIKLHSHM